MFIRRIWNEWSVLQGDADPFVVLQRAAEQRRAETEAGLPHHLEIAEHEGILLPPLSSISASSENKLLHHHHFHHPNPTIIALPPPKSPSFHSDITTTASIKNG